MSSIASFYAGRSVLITGGTGFIGKCMLEKLLRSCPHIENIYVLVRPKKNVPVQKRFNELVLQSQAFDRVRAINPDFARKLTPVEGDVGLDGLGLSDSDHKKITDNVTVVINSAATLNMQAHIKTALKINTFGPLRLLSLCKQLSKCDSFVHLSTTFSQSPRRHVEEKIYESPIAFELLLSVISTLEKDELKVRMKDLLQETGYPNTYSFSKAITEKLLQEEKQDIPLCIVRPSITGAASTEPFPGWLDNVSAYSAYVAGIGTASLRHMRSRNVLLDVIPVDFVVNGILVAAADTARRKNQTEVNVINSSAFNKMQSVNNWIRQAVRFTKEYPIPGLPFQPHIKIYNSPKWAGYKPDFMEQLYVYGFQLPLYFLLDFIDHAIYRREPKKVRSVFEYRGYEEVLSYFACTEYYFDNSKLKKLQSNLTDADKKEFNCLYPDNFDYNNYVKDYWYGMRKYWFKTNVSDESETATSQLQPVNDKHSAIDIVSNKISSRA